MQAPFSPQIEAEPWVFICKLARVKNIAKTKIVRDDFFTSGRITAKLLFLKKVSKMFTIVKSFIFFRLR